MRVAPAPLRVGVQVRHQLAGELGARRGEEVARRGCVGDGRVVRLRQQLDWRSRTHRIHLAGIIDEPALNAGTRNSLTRTELALERVIRAACQHLTAALSRAIIFIAY